MGSIGELRSFRGLLTVTKPELGTKRLCASCSARFYDLNKTPITCPKCGTPFEVVPTTTRPRFDRRAAVRKPEPETEEVQEAEMISLEDADAEVQGKKVPVPADDAEAIEDVETDETVEDEDKDTFIEEVDEEDTDISEIIDGDIKDEEET
jgi:uncharacterized protein (TIGR02300 family)